MASKKVQSASNTSSGPFTRSKAKEGVIIAKQQVASKHTKRVGGAKTSSISTGEMEARKMREIEEIQEKHDRALAMEEVDARKKGASLPHELSMDASSRCQGLSRINVNSDVGSESGSSSPSPKHWDPSNQEESSRSLAVQAMTTGASSLEEKLGAMMEAIEKLQMTVGEKDLQIATLMNKLESLNVVEMSQGNSHPTNPKEKDSVGPFEYSHRITKTLDPVEVKQGNAPQYEAARQGSSAIVPPFSTKQLEDLIQNAVRA